MHIYFMTRGIKHLVDKFVNDIGAQSFPYEMGGQKYFVQAAMRPIQLWECVIPETGYDQFMKMLFVTNGTMNCAKTFEKVRMNALRFALRADPMKEFDESVGQRLIANECVAIHPIGIKKDKYDPIKKKENL